ncbi:hypothetical protein [Desulfobacula toluolica]|nr:hypothetical protein [Desulfobacula toluolica]
MMITFFKKAGIAGKNVRLFFVFRAAGFDIVLVVIILGDCRQQNAAF